MQLLIDNGLYYPVHVIFFYHFLAVTVQRRGIHHILAPIPPDLSTSCIMMSTLTLLVDEC